MDRRVLSLVLLLLCLPGTILSTENVNDEAGNEDTCECECDGYTFSYKKAGGAIVGAAVVVAGVPYVLTAAGFGAAGVAAGSVAAKVMALFGGAVPAGGVFATLQSVGAAGLGVLGNMAAGVTGSFTGYVFGDLFTEACECTCPEQ